MGLITNLKKTFMHNQKNLSSIVTLWKKEKKQFVKKSTFSAYVLLIENHLSPVFGDKHVITEAEVQKFVLAKLTLGLSHKTVKDILIVLKMVLKYGAKHKWIEYIPFEIRFPTERVKHTVDVLTRSHQKVLMQYIQQHFTFRNLGVYICLCSGIRIGEICALTWEDIDTENGVINVRRTIQRIYNIEDDSRKTEVVLDTPKTKNSIREIPINKELLRMLKPMKKIVNPSFFVLTNDAKPTEPRTYRNYYKELIKTIGLPELKFHGLRHSFATRCIESKCDYKTVSVLLGHSNISTTLNLYVHPNLEQKKKVIDLMFNGLK
ncbi:MAG: site-specific integrase [Sphingobacteriales bacterium JAD_PAG50586_3]|nr:MAG: site-specific integrase [Sphingobacteriales bacterium JAD_PAG50586_3]